MSTHQPSQQESGKHMEPAHFDKNNFLIVGIGASAGGIEAIRAFFMHVPADSNMAYVVILHLSPEHESHLAEVLQQTAKIPVAQVTEKVHVEPNRVYVIPPNQHLEMADGHITVTPNITFEERRAPVDIFFRTLAESHDSRAVAVILSGTGANGSMGIKRIKENGGVAFVQSPREAQFNEMPRNSIATELIDAVLPVAEIPAKIIDYRNSLGLVEIPEAQEQRPDEQQQALREILTQLRVRTGHDFTNYKMPTLLRRFKRRINVRGVANLPEYAAFIRKQPEELEALLKDLLISVTNFFRDTKAFEALEQEILPVIMKDKKAADQIRIWVAGCATGEEAYSIAMLCAEHTMDVLDAPQIQIFATDIDEDAIAMAREGVYTINDAADVSPERLQRFFIKEGNEYRVCREIRETILFATHNLIKDPPFSHLHLASCRNMLIYLNHLAQQRVMETFHFALNPGGYLFLGTSESVDGAGDLYTPINRGNRIYQSRQLPTRIIPQTDGFYSFRFQAPKEKQPMQENENRMMERVSFGGLHQQLLEQYAPPSVIINENYDVLHVSEHAGKFMQVAGGHPSTNLLNLIRPDLRLELRSALYTAVQHKSNTQTKPVTVFIDSKQEAIRMHVRPVLRENNAARGFLLVVFEKETPANENGGNDILTSDEPIARHLEDELINTKEQLRSSAEQHELQAEELKASNEELQALNEELRSAAEELETSKEELQSINEELRTVNQELKIKIEEISHTSNNLQNLINSTNIGTIFLDRSLRVVLFTPEAQKIFNLIPGDIGRPLSDITNRLTGDDLVTDAATVLNKLQLIEREVQTNNSRHYSLRLLPYRTGEDRINGVVLTFVDITERKKADEAVIVSEKKYRTLFNSIDEGFCIFKLQFNEEGKAVDWLYTEANPAFETQTGFTNPVGKLISYFQPDLESSWFERFVEVAHTGVPIRFTQFTEAMNIWYDVYAQRVGETGENQVSLLFTNITERKRQELRQKFLLKLSDALRPLSNSLALQRKALSMLREHLGGSRTLYAEALDQEGTMKITAESRDATLSSMEGLVFRFSDFTSKAFHEASQGNSVWLNDVFNDEHTPEQQAGYAALGTRAWLMAPLVKDGRLVANFTIHNATPRAWTAEEIAFVQETTERIWAAVERGKAEEALQKSEEKYRSIFKTINEGFTIIEIITDENDNIVDVIYREANEAFEQHTGIKNVVGKKASEFVPHLEQHWLDSMTHVYKTGEPVRLESYQADLQRWLTAQYSRVGGPGSTLFAVVFIDITERKRREQEQAFLLRFSDNLLAASTANAVANCALEMLIEHLRLDRSYIVSYYLNENIALLDYQIGNETVSPLPYTFDLSQYPEAYKAVLNKTLVIEDDFERQDLLAAEKQNVGKLGMRAMVAATVRKGENKPLWSMVAINSRPRRWTPDEIKLIETVAERTWAAVERAKAEEALRESEERLRIATSASGIYSWEYNITDNIYSFSDNAANILGVSKLPQTPEEGWRLAYPDDKVLIQNTLKDAFDKGEGFMVDFRSVKDNGTVVWLSVQTTMITDADGKACRLLGIAQDVSERKKAEESLRESEERFRAFFNQSTAAIAEYDTNGTHILINETFAKSINYTPEELIGMNLREITHPDDLPHFLELFNKAIETGKSVTTEKRLLCLKGNYIWVADTISPIAGGKEGKVERVLSVGIDITQRKKTELFIHESEQRYRIALEAGELATWDWNLKTDKVAWNEQHFRLFGIEHIADTISPEYFLEFIYPEDIALVKQQLAEVVGGTGIYVAEFRIRRKDNGKMRWMSGYGRITERENGNPTRISGVMYDSTDRKKLEQQKDDFIGIASHELKTPLTSIKAYTEMLLEMNDGSDYETSGFLIKKLNLQVDRLIELVHTLLDTSKIEEGKLFLRFEEFDLRVLIEERAEDLQRTSGIHHFIVPPNKETLITADLERIGQVLTNLISNAIKYSPKGGNITINWKQTAEETEICVQDEGMGISEDIQSKVFDRFFRAHDVLTSTFPGMGLGLYITANIVHRHNGRIWVKSKPGEGSTFYFTIPDLLHKDNIAG